MKHNARLYIFTLLYIAVHSSPKIMRNNALMTKMISHFQKGNDKNNNLSNEQGQKVEPRLPEMNERTDENQHNQPNIQSAEFSTQRPRKVLNLMQNVLCRNFPTIPCKIIMQDKALRQLIERSIQQITYKKERMDLKSSHTHQQEEHRHNQQEQQMQQEQQAQRLEIQTKFPTINSEDLSNFLEVSNTGYFKDKGKSQLSKRYSGLKKSLWSHEMIQKKQKGKDTKHGKELNSGRKKLRKFYPHKVKYKDKNSNREYREFSEEKISMSAELPDLPPVKPKTERLAYKVDPSDTPVWRIDYMKHGVPSVNVGFADERLRGKLMKSGQSPLSEQLLRKDVLRPDVYIKKNLFRKNINTISDVLD